ncbi:MAG: hypothetical protein HWD58_03755 [Bacteroidota bacterium]|nr:MAG: hypothetical protein HWD58_03755 [Bacteroidota bacterium]
MNQEKKAIENYINALKELHKLGVLKSKHDFTSQIGEWLIETIYGGKRADNSIQKGWDIDVNGYHIQVKAHAKAEGNSNRWSAVDKNETEKIDELIIIEFTRFYKILKFYKVTWSEALKHIKSRNIKSPRFELSWSSIESFHVNLDDLPNQNVVSIFR